MKNVFLLLLAIVLTGGLLVGANAVNANNAVKTADMSGSCCPSTTTIQTQQVDSGCCPSEAAPIAVEKESGCSGDTQSTTISAPGCPSSGSCSGSAKSEASTPSKKSI